MAIPITKTQKEILDQVINHNEKYGFSPTLGELAKMFNKAQSTMWEHLAHLEGAGRIKIHFHKARGIEVLNDQA